MGCGTVTNVISMHVSRCSIQCATFLTTKLLSLTGAELIRLAQILVQVGVTQFYYSQLTLGYVLLRFYIYYPSHMIIWLV